MSRYFGGRYWAARYWAARFWHGLTSGANNYRARWANGGTAYRVTWKG